MAKEDNNVERNVNRGRLIHGLIGVLAGGVIFLAGNYLLQNRNADAKPPAQVNGAQKDNSSNLEKICELDLHLNLTSDVRDSPKEILEQYLEAYKFGQSQAEKYHGLPATTPARFSVKELDGLVGRQLDLFGRNYKIMSAHLIDSDGQTQLLLNIKDVLKDYSATLISSVFDGKEDYFPVPIIQGPLKGARVSMECSLNYEHGKANGTAFTLSRIKIVKP